MLRAVLTAIEREELSQQVRLTTTAQEVVRTASRRLGYRELLPETRKLLADGFRADDLAVLVFTDPPPDIDPDSPLRLPARLMVAATDAARRAWHDQTVVIAEPGRVWGDEPARRGTPCRLSPPPGDHGTGALVLAPIGAGPEPLGVMLIARRAGEARWTESESAAALDVGHDLGRAILNTRAHDRERQLITELTRLDEHRTPADLHGLPRAEEPARRDHRAPRDAGGAARPPRAGGPVAAPPWSAARPGSGRSPTTCCC